MNEITREFAAAAALALHLARVGMNWSIALAYLPVALLTRSAADERGA
jgi:hypothetical protein